MGHVSPNTANISWRSEDKPAAVNTGLLDDLIGAGEQGLRDREPECLCGVQVDNQLEFRRLLDCQIGRLRALQDLIHENGGPVIMAGEAGAVETNPPSGTIAGPSV